MKHIEAMYDLTNNELEEVMSDANEKEFWSYLMGNGVVYPLGEFEGDFNAVWPKVFDEAERVADAHKTEPVFAVSETDLTEISSHVENCFNTMQNMMGYDYYLVSTFIDKKDFPLLQELVMQYPDCGFLESLLYGCRDATLLKMEKK